MTNQTRQMISEQQKAMLSMLVDGKPRMVKHLAEAEWSAFAVDTTREAHSPQIVIGREDRKARMKWAWRARRRLEHWSFVRLFKAPHADADTTYDEFYDRAAGEQREIVPEPEAWKDSRWPII